MLRYLPGGNLEAWCERNPSILGDPRLHHESWLLPIAPALDAVAAQGIIHRDGKQSLDGRTLGQLVAFIDAHLRIEPALGEMGMRVGLSPSHFARKVRHSTGLSLHRFVNRRRIRAALDVLKDERCPLAGIALDLGFSSQTHFTRLFSDLTGTTPAKYRKLFRRTVG